VSAVRFRPSFGAFARDPQFDLSIWWPAHAAEFAGEMAGFRFSLGLPEDRVRYLRGIAPGRVEVVGPWERPGWVRADVGLDSSLYAELVVFGPRPPVRDPRQPGAGQTRWSSDAGRLWPPTKNCRDGGGG